MLISLVSLYLNTLKAPQLALEVAPYIRHVIDNSSDNESFFIPLTLTNDGARNTALTSLELAVTHLPSGQERVFYGQYFAQDRTNLGAFFTPINLAGYSDSSHTVAFYPLGGRTGERLFGPAGQYQFALYGQTTGAGSEATLLEEFSVSLGEEQALLIESTPDGEFPFPVVIER